MKKLNKKSFAVVGLALVLSATALTGCKTDELDAKIDENASKAEAAVSEAASKAADDLAAAKSALEAKITSGDTANTEELTKAIADLNKAIDAAKKAAEDGDTGLNAAIEAASKTAADAIKALEEDLTAKYTALQTALSTLETGSAAKLAEEIKTVNEAIEAAKKAATDGDAALQASIKAAQEAALKAAADLQEALTKQITELATKLEELKSGTATSINELTAKAGELATELAALKKDLTDADKALDNQLTALQTAVDSLSTSLGNVIASLGEYVDKETWNETTEKLIAKMVELNDAKNEAVAAAGTNATLKAKVEAVYAEGYVRILRALDDVMAQKALDDAKEVLGGVKKITDAYEPYQEKIDDGKYDAGGQKKLEDAYKDALDRFDKLGETGNDDTVDKIVEDLKNALEKVLTQDEATSASGLAARVAELLAKLTDETDKNAYNKINRDEYLSIVDAVDTLKGTAGDGVMATINADGQYDDLIEAYAERKAEFDAEADAKLDILSKYDADYVVVYKDDCENIVDAYNQVKAWLNEQETNRGFTVENAAEVHDVFDAFKTFRNTKYARALNLETARLNGLTLKAQMTALANNIEVMTIITAEYPAQFAQIQKDVEGWDKAHFSGDYAAEMDPEHKGYSNYQLLDHEQYEALIAAYEESVQKFIDAANDAAEAILNVTKPIDLMSQAEVDNAQAKFDKIWDMIKLESVGIDLSIVENAKGHFADMNAMYLEMVALQDALRSKKLAAAADYEALVLAKADAKVTVYSGDDLEALKDWYNEYLTLDITDADVEWVGGSLKLSDTITVTEDDFNKACQACKDYDTLTAAKKAKEAEIKAAVEAILAANGGEPCTEQRTAIDAAKALIAEWADGSYAPEGFDADQIKAAATDTALDAEKAALDAREAEVVALEARRDAIVDRINKIETDNDLTTEAGRTAAAAEIASIKADIDTLKTDNAGVDCIPKAAQTTLKKAEVALTYYEALEQIALINAEDVKTDITKIADAAKKEADDLLEENPEADLALPLAKLDLVKYTAEQYVANQATVGDLAARYLAAKENLNITSVDQVEQRKQNIAQAFTL